jgi:tRNA(Ile)-lysidine synthase
MPVGVAVSGGADSVYLLHELMGRGMKLVVLHVNHGLRGAESDGDERFVRELAGRLGVECLVHRGEVGAGNLEQEARRVRYAWFRELVERGAVERVVLGHTRSDQAETVLFRFLRGSGTAGLAGIRAETDLVWRPMLGLTREEVRESLRARGIGWREDSSNGDARFARNRIRTELLPQLMREWNPRLPETLAQTADWAQAEESYWAAEMKKLARKTFREERGGVAVRMPKLPAAVERRLLRYAIEKVKGDLRGIEFGHVEAIRELRSGRVNVPGAEVEKSFEWVRILPVGYIDPAKPSDIRLELRAAADVYNISKHQLDWGIISGPLKLRCWQSGDRYRRAGQLKEDRLKLLFQKARVPVWERRRWPVLMCGEGIGWTRGFGAAAGLERTESTQVVLLIQDVLGNSESEAVTVTSYR